MYCLYYTAHVRKEKIWLIIAHLKSHDNIAFHRTMDGGNNIMEFFVPPAHEKIFTAFMDAYQRHGLLNSYHQAPNRLIPEALHIPA